NRALEPASYLSRLSGESWRLQMLRSETAGMSAILNIAATLLEAADPTLARRWHMLGVCPAPFEAVTAASVWAEEDDDSVADALDQLVQRALLSYDPASGRYHLHQLLHETAPTGCLAEDAIAAHLRHGAHYRAI